MKHNFPSWSMPGIRFSYDYNEPMVLEEPKELYVKCTKCYKQIMEVSRESYETPVCDFCRGVTV